MDLILSFDDLKDFRIAKQARHAIIFRHYIRSMNLHCNRGGHHGDIAGMAGGTPFRIFS
jgi:hypothetical protein